MNKNAKRIPAWAAWMVSLVVFALVLTAGGLSLYINVTVGLTMGIAAAVMFGISDVGKIVLPIVMECTGKHPLLRTTYYMAAFASIFCAVLATADMFGQRLVMTETNANSAKVGARNIEDLRATLKSTREMMVSESQTGCKDRCQALVKRVSQIEGQILEATATQQETAAPTMSGKGLLGQVLFAIPSTKVDTVSTVALIVIQLVMMELLSHTAGFAASMVGVAIAATKASRKAKRAKAARVAKAEAKVAEKQSAKIILKQKESLRKRRVTAKKKAAEAAKIAAEMEAKKQATIAKRKATIAAKKAALAPAQPVAEKPKRKWTQKQTEAHLRRVLAKKQAAVVA